MSNKKYLELKESEHDQIPDDLLEEYARVKGLPDWWATLKLFNRNKKKEGKTNHKLLMLLSIQSDRQKYLEYDTAYLIKSKEERLCNILNHINNR